MTSRRLGLVGSAIELGHRHPECFRDALDLAGLGLGVFEFDPTEPSDLDVRLLGEVLLAYSAQLSPVPHAPTGSQAHPCILHREQRCVNYRCTVSN